MNKQLISSFILAIATAFGSPVFAQTSADISSGAVTRAQVRAGLVELQQAGYNPASDQTQYPANIQAAENRLQAQRGAAATGYGPSIDGTSASGSTLNVTPGFGNGPDFQRP